MKKYLVLFAVIQLVITLQAQDVHLSHIHASPIHLNPAMTGVFQDGYLRLIANSRLQWETFTKGYKTVMASADLKLVNLNNSSILSGGIQVASDKAGDLNFSTNTASINFSVQKSFDRQSKNVVSFGFQGALINHRIDFSKMIGYEIETELITDAPETINAWDVSTGVTWFHSFYPKNHFYIGAALFHLNQPSISFFGDLDLYELPYDEVGKILYRKFIIHGGGKIGIHKNISLLPSFLIADQGPHREMKMGTFFKYENRRSRKDNDYAVYLGGWVRWYLEKDLIGTDAIDLSLRIDHESTIYTFSFDVNISKLTRVSQGLGGPELSVIKIFDKKNTKRKKFKVKCPAL